MLPSLVPGQIVVIWTAPRLRAGDIVMAMVSGREVVKRIAQQKGSLVMLHGDNPRASTDSRAYGPVQEGAVVGKVVWPRLKPLE